MAEELSAQEILQALSSHRPLSLPASGARPASVLVPIRVRDTGLEAPQSAADLEVIFTRRAAHLKKHAGQVSFPGGAVDAEDRDRAATALREFQEELGVPRHHVEVIGRLDDTLTITGFHITQIVGLVPPNTSLHPDPQEVATVFSVPMAELLRPERWQQRARSWHGQEVLVWHFLHGDEDIWGATGGMVRAMVEMLWRVRKNL